MHLNNFKIAIYVCDPCMASTWRLLADLDFSQPGLLQG